MEEILGLADLPPDYLPGSTSSHILQKLLQHCKKTTQKTRTFMVRTPTKYRSNLHLRKQIRRQENR